MYGPQIDTTGFPEELAASIHRFVAHAASSNAQHEAAYAQALRDTRDRMRSIERDMGSKAWAAGWAADEIEDLAQETGIDL